MKFYVAPMEGITGYVYRNAHARYFGHVDKYFMPFIAPNQHGRFSTRELHDILPEHNKGISAIPQILTNKADDFIRTSKQLAEFGYNEINLNLGCPSGTVVAKGKGSGFLAYPEQLQTFLDTIFETNVTKISIKTRLGKEDPREFEKLLQLFNQYPLEELIIHPRVQKDFYKHDTRTAYFKNAVEQSKHQLCYNGDLFTQSAFKECITAFPQVNAVMLGRGIIANPGLIDTLRNGCMLDKKLLKAFHEELYLGYQEILSGERNVLFKMKETWFYMNHLFTNHEKYAKKIRKAQRLKEYEEIIERLFEEEQIQPDKGFVWR